MISNYQESTTEDNRAIILPITRCKGVPLYGNGIKSMANCKQKLDMAVNVVVRGKWKPVELDPSLFLHKDMNHLICIEELTDYNIEERKKSEVFWRKCSVHILSPRQMFGVSPPFAPRRYTAGLDS